MASGHIFQDQETHGKSGIGRQFRRNSAGPKIARLTTRLLTVALRDEGSLRLLDEHGAFRLAS